MLSKVQKRDKRVKVSKIVHNTISILLIIIRTVIVPNYQGYVHIKEIENLLDEILIGWLAILIPRMKSF